tara:strand:+ start:52804 stop:53799 length:996 start_codon:yes stop_codon:yes gene_type:complete
MPRYLHRAHSIALVIVCAVVVAVHAPSPVHAQSADVAVLPITTTAKALRIYRNAIPVALAAEMTTLLGVSVRAVSSASDVAKDTRVLIDGRLVAIGDDRVQLDVQVRRASTGQTVATISSNAANTTDIDRLVGQVATGLGPVLAKALTPEPYQLPTTVVQGSSSPKAKAIPMAAGAAIPPGSQVLLLPAEGSAAKGMIGVREPATQAAAHMLARIGQAVRTSSKHQGIANPIDVVAEMRSLTSKHALMVQVLSVRFSYASVLSARGKVRIVLIGQDGLAVLDANVSTDTVVGGRGERHQALVYRVAEQALDMLQPRIKRALEIPTSHRGGA